MRFSNLITGFIGTSSLKHDNIGCTRSTRLFSTTGPVIDLPPLVSSPLTESVQAAIKTRQSHANGDEYSYLSNGIREWLIPSAAAADASPPSQEEIKLLREAFATFYGVDRDFQKAETLLTKAIEAWQKQPADERAGLYRVRGDCYMRLLQPQNAEKDYTTAIELLQGPGGEQADPTELPTSLLGRARAIRSQGKAASQTKLSQASKDYQLSLRLSARDEWDTDEENEEDGAKKNPYACWEWGSTLRSLGDLENAAKIHRLASESFDDIGDKTRSIMSQMDEGIDLAAMNKASAAKETITGAIKNMKKIEGGDVELLQRLLAKEGESRVALASVLWDSGDKQEAESLLGTACLRLEQLEADAAKRIARKAPTEPEQTLRFSIDDQIGAGVSCSRFGNENFLSETIDWPEALQKKAIKFVSLGK